MSALGRRAAFSVAAFVFALSLVIIAVAPTEAWARPGGSHHESNQGETYKKPKATTWQVVVKVVKVYIVRPVTEVVTGGDSSPVCH
jgi:hypothetical protein